MNSLERSTPIETNKNKNDNITKSLPEFKPIEQRISLSIELVNTEYKNKL